jgi:hypothetical protein
MPDEQQGQVGKVAPVSRIDEPVVNQERAEPRVVKQGHHHKKKHKAEKGKKR